MSQPRTPPRLRRPLLAALAATLLLLLPAGSARAAYFAGTVVDGPSAAIVNAGAMDVARDGSGAVAYVRQDEGANHIFVARLVNGVFAAPERIDAGLPASSQPAVAASDGGRLVIAFVSGGTLYTVLRPAGAGYGAPQAIAAGASSPSVDMSINGVAYVSFTAPGVSAADVRVAGLGRAATGFTLLPDVLDINPADDAGVGDGRSKIAVSADGTALVTWGETMPDGRSHVIARRAFGARISTAPQDLTLDSFAGHAGGAADLPNLDIEDDSSFAWVVFRERFDDGHLHAIARRLVGSAFEAPAQVDGLPFGVGDAAETAIDLSGRGEGIEVTGAGGNGTFGAILHDDQFFPGTAIGPGGPVVDPAAGIAENNFAYGAWLPGDGTAVIRPYKIEPAKANPPGPGDTQVMSSPDFGAVDPSAGLDLGVNRAGDAVGVFVQGTGDGRRLVAGGFDRVPGVFRTYTTSRVRDLARPPLSWQPSFELWGPVTYTVLVDNQPVGQTTDTHLALTTPLADGDHPWKVVATDRRGQSFTAPVRTLRVDATPPQATIAVSGTRKAGKPLTVSVTAADGTLAAPTGSGVKSVTIDFGDGSPVVKARTAKHAYAKGGAFTIRVGVTDQAGNVAAVTKPVTVKKAKKAKRKR